MSSNRKFVIDTNIEQCLSLFAKLSVTGSLFMRNEFTYRLCQKEKRNDE